MKLGQVINKYKVIELFKEHKHSTTGACLNVELKTKWFIKFVPKAFLDGSDELNNLLMLDHGSVPKIIDVIHALEGSYIILEFVQGMMLNDYLSQHKLSLKEYITIIVSITQTLEHIHCYGVVHGDIKSENIMIGPNGYVYLIDFGSSFIDLDSKSFTMDLVAPERLLDSYPADERSDLYTLGIVMETMMVHYLNSVKLKGHYFTLRSIKKIIKKCLRINPSDRFQSANEIKDALLLIK